MKKEAKILTASLELFFFKKKKKLRDCPDQLRNNTLEDSAVPRRWPPEAVWAGTAQALCGLKFVLH